MTVASSFEALAKAQRNSLQKTFHAVYMRASYSLNEEATTGCE